MTLLDALVLKQSKTPKRQPATIWWNIWQLSVAFISTHSDLEPVWIVLCRIKLSSSYLYMAETHYDTPWKVTQPANIVIQLRWL